MGVIGINTTTSLASMSGISSQGDLSISTSHTKASEITGEIAGFITDIGAYLFGEKIGDMIGNYTSPYVDELAPYKNIAHNIDKAIIGNVSFGNILDRVENVGENLGSISGNLIKENHTLLGDIVSNTIKGGNTFMSNSYIQANGEASINTDNLVNVDIGNVKIDSNQTIDISGGTKGDNIFEAGWNSLVVSFEGVKIGSKLFVGADLQQISNNISNILDRLEANVSINGTNSLTMNDNRSSISENITINANNTPTLNTNNTTLNTNYIYNINNRLNFDVLDTIYGFDIKQLIVDSMR